MIRVLFAAGGTGGHIYPAISINEALEEIKDLESLFVGVGREAEKKILGNSKYNYKIIPFTPVVGKGFLGLVKLVFSFPFSLIKGISLIKNFKPDIVIGCGGYPSFIPVISSFILRVPVFLLEPNTKAGLATKILKVFSKKIFANKSIENFKSPKLELINTPVRKHFLDIKPLTEKDLENKISILITGGSQGAKTLNSGVLSSLKKLDKDLLDKIEIVHQSGELDFNRVKKEYQNIGIKEVKVFSFIDEIWKFYKTSNLIISRAGAMSVSEILATSRPSIFIPLKGAEGHQKRNALPLVNALGAYLIEENKDLENNLTSLLRDLILNPKKLIEISLKAKEFSTLETELSSSKKIAKSIIEEISKNSK